MGPRSKPGHVRFPMFVSPEVQRPAVEPPGPPRSPQHRGLLLPRLQRDALTVGALGSCCRVSRQGSLLELLQDLKLFDQNSGGFACA